MNNYKPYIFDGSRSTEEFRRLIQDLRDFGIEVKEKDMSAYGWKTPSGYYVVDAEMVMTCISGEVLIGQGLPLHKILQAKISIVDGDIIQLSLDPQTPFIYELLPREGERSMTRELKPCPFCGSTEDLQVLTPDDRAYCLNRPAMNGCGVVCWHCGLFYSWDMDYGGTCDTEIEAIESWNRRVE